MCVCVCVCVQLCRCIFHVRFDPDRFNTRKGLEFCPFGVPSQRKCPGFAFAYFEVGVFASVLLQSFCVEAVSTEPVEMVYSLVTKPKDDLDLLVYIKPRGNA